MTAAKAVKPVDTAKAANLGVLFAIEVGVLVAVGYWGFTRDIATPLTWLLGIGGPVVLAVVWGLCGSPKARYKVRGPGGLRSRWCGSGPGPSRWSSPGSTTGPSSSLSCAW